MVTLETNVDDCSPQVLAYVQECLRDAGAIDTYAAPIVMKKGRLGTLLGVVCEADAADALTKIIFAETTSLGVRKTRIERAELRRKIVNVTTSTGDEVAVKVGYDDDGSIVNVHPEYEDAARVARRRGVPLKQVAEEAMDVARKQGILISSSSSSSAAAEACEQSEASGSEP